MADTEKEVDELRREVRQLREEMRELIRAAGHESSGDGNGNGGAKWREKVNAFMEQVRDRSTQAIGTAREHVNERPLTSVVTAFSAGMMLGRFLPRGSKE